MRILAISTTNINSYVALKNNDLIDIKNVTHSGIETTEKRG